MGNSDAAIREYRAVASYYPGARAHYLLGLALKNSGKDEAAVEEFNTMIRDAELAPAHFRKSEKNWLALAARELKDLMARDTTRN
jgi:hypothetical protein